MHNPLLRTIICFWISMFSVLGLQGQKAIVDSLIQELSITEDESDKISLLHRLGDHYTDADRDSSYYYYDLAINLAKENDLKSLLGKSLANKGVTASIHRNYELSDSLYEETLKIYKALKVKNSRVVNTYINLLINQMGNANVEKAQMFFDSATVYVQEDDVKSQFKVNDIMHYLLSRQERHEEALAYARKNLNLVEDTDMVPQIAMALKVLATSFSNLDNIDSTIFYGEKAIALRKAHVRDEELSSAMTLVGGNYMLNAEYDKALPLLKEAELIKDDLKIKFDRCSNYSALALTYYHLGRRDLAQDYCEKVWQLNTSYNDIGCMKKALETSYRVLKYMGEDAEALVHFEKSIEYRDSLNSLDNQRIILDLEKRLELKEKESTIAEKEYLLEMESSKRVRMTIIAFLALLVLSLGFFVLNQKQKEKQRLIEFELQQEKLESEKHEELSKLKSKFFTNLSHELRTPLTLVLGPLEQSLSRIKDELIKKDVELAYKNSNQLLGLVNEILDLSKLEAGSLQMNEHPAHFENLTKRIFFSFESLAGIRDIQLDYLSEVKEPLEILIDQSKYEKVLNNLVSNAIKFSDNSSRIELLVAEVKDGVKVMVRDFGRGIHPDDIDHVFDRFFQTNQTKAIAEGGTGIGLSYANELVKAFGGKLKVSSQLGEGSTFSFILPRSRFKSTTLVEEVSLIKAKSEEQEQSYRSINFDANKSRILIVEDNSQMQTYLTSILSDKYICDVAGDGIEALEKLSKEEYDLITSDVMMPRMDGFQFKEALGALEQHQTTSFVMLTARSLEEDKIKGFKLGVDDYLLKPFSKDELLARIENLLINRRERVAFRSSQEAEAEVSELNAEQQILKQAEDFILDNIDDHELTVPALAKGLGYSQRQVTRVLKKLSGLTPVNFILEIRLQKARRLLEAKQFLSIDEVRYQVGIESPSYFSRKYKERFGKRPTEELHSN